MYVALVNTQDMITDNEPLLTKYISVPRESSSLNCGAFVAGLVESVLDASQFVSFKKNSFQKPCSVTAHSTSTDAFPTRTTILIKFDKSVMTREAQLEAK